MLITALSYLSLSNSIQSRARLLSISLADSVVTHLQDGNWIQAQERINSHIKSNELSYIRIYSGSDDLYGPVGKKNLLTECSKASYEKFKIEACGQLLEQKSLIGFVISFIITLSLVFLCLHVIKGHISKTNKRELEQLKELKSINVFNIESSKTYINEFIEIESHIKKLVSSISTATRAMARSSNARRLVHDLRAPLNQVIQDFLPNGKIDEAKSTLERIVQNAENDLNITISKSIPLSTIASEVNAYKNQTQNTPASITIHHHTQGEVWIKLPPGVLEAALLNFTRNTQETQTIPPEIMLNVHLSDNHINIEFRDNGPGFPEEALTLLNLGQFVKSTKKNGTGVGLSEIYKALNENGSRIIYSNLPHGGATIRLTIPAFGSHPSSPKIWHVEDDKYVRNSWIKQSQKRNLPITSLSPESFQETPTSDLCVGDVYFFDLNTAPLSGYDHAKTLAERGANHLYITTAEDVPPEDIPFYISGIIGKKAPWQITE